MSRPSLGDQDQSDTLEETTERWAPSSALSPDASPLIVRTLQVKQGAFRLAALPS